MATFAELLAGITDPQERAYMAARIFVNPELHGVSFRHQRAITYEGWTLTVEKITQGLEGRAIGLYLDVVTPEGEHVPLDNPFYIINPPYEVDGVENPLKAWILMITRALHDAVLAAGYEPPF